MQTLKVDFINGDFSSKEALEILSQVYAHKIRFHELKNFSHIERFGTTDKTSLKRIKELKRSIKHINTHLKRAQKQSIYIQSDITLTIT